MVRNESDLCGLELCLLPDRYGIVKLDSGVKPPPWLNWSASFISVTRTAEELSIIAPCDDIPVGVPGLRDLRLFGVTGPLSMDAVGIMHGLTSPLADAGIWILALSTHDTDYLVVRDSTLAAAVQALGSRFRVLGA